VPVWNRATLGLVAISGSRSYLEGQLQAIERAVHNYAIQSGVELTDIYAEVLPETS
jgi:uncharacterized protein